MPGLVDGDSGSGVAEPIPAHITMDSIKKHIPKEAFTKSYFWSTFYLVRDFAIFFVLYSLKDFICWTWIGYFAWVNVVGFMGWAMFVVGHDCGHGSFSPSWWYNQVCGHLAHTVLLVPFNPWQISHHHHHLYHNHIEKDESWKPMTKEYYYQGTRGILFSLVRKTPVMLFLYPWYLAGVPDSPLLSGSHFWPWSRLFKPEQRLRAGVSVVAIIVWLTALFLTFNATDLFTYYFMPVNVTYMWLSLVTYLQHTDPKGKYYDRDHWTYLKGGLTGTIDRDFGPIINHLHHNIETHVLHHIYFTSIPHYNLRMATDAVIPFLGENYILDKTPIIKAFLRSIGDCDYVDYEKSGHTKWLRYFKASPDDEPAPKTKGAKAQ